MWFCKPGTIWDIKQQTWGAAEQYTDVYVCIYIYYLTMCIESLCILYHGARIITEELDIIICNVGSKSNESGATWSTRTNKLIMNMCSTWDHLKTHGPN